MKSENDKTVLSLELPTYIVTGAILDRVEAETPFEWEILQQIKSKKSVIKQRLNSMYGSAVYTDTDSTKVVSRETLKLEPDELEVLLNVARVLNGECGQIGGNCQNCFCHCDKEVLGSKCLINQIHEIRRKYL